MDNDLRPTEVPSQGGDCGYRKMVLKGKKKKKNPGISIVLSALCGLTRFSSSQSYEAVMPLSTHLTDKRLTLGFLCLYSFNPTTFLGSI